MDLQDLPNLRSVDMRFNLLEGGVPNIQASNGGSCLMSNNRFLCEIDPAAKCSQSTPLPPCDRNGNPIADTSMDKKDSNGVDTQKIVLGCVMGLVAAVLLAVVFVYIRRRNANKERTYRTAATIKPSEIRSIDGSKGPWWANKYVKLQEGNVTKMHANSQVRRIPIDGAFPGMPSSRHSGADAPAYVDSEQANQNGNQPTMNSIIGPKEAPERRSSKVSGSSSRTGGVFSIIFGSKTHTDTSSSFELETVDLEAASSPPERRADAKSLYSHHTAFAVAASSRSAKKKARDAARQGKSSTAQKTEFNVKRF